VAQGLQTSAAKFTKKTNVENPLNPSSKPQGRYSDVACVHSPASSLVGALTVALGAFGAFAAFAAPPLFGPMAAIVIATERLLRATHARDPTLTASSLALAVGWIALATRLLHAPLLSYAGLEAGLTVLVLGSGGCWVWSRMGEATNRYVDILAMVAGSAVALGILYGGGDMTIGRISAAASVALALVGVEWVLTGIAGADGRALVMRRAVVGDHEGGRSPAWTPRITPGVHLPADVR